MSLYILGLHAHHGDLQIDTFSDVGYLLKHRPWGSKVLVAGDWNVDQLPALDGDPYNLKPGRDTHHKAERVLLQSLADRFRLTVHLPEIVYSTPGGPFDDVCSRAPISRIPTGETVAYCLPSLLDYGLGSKGFVKATSLHWHGAPADHGFVAFSLAPACTLRRGAKTTWKCKDESECREWISNNAPDQFDDVGCFHAFLIQLQNMWADNQTCKERRQQRMPANLRDLYSQMASTTCEHARKMLQDEAWTIRKNWCLDRKAMMLSESVRKGKVFGKSKKLHQIEALVIPSADPGVAGRVSRNAEEWKPELDRNFSNKWGTRRFQDRETLTEFLQQNDGRGIKIEFAQLCAAFDKIQRWSKTDHYGVSVAAIKLIAYAKPALACSFLGNLIASSCLMSQIVVKGHLFGKESSVTSAASTRAILPLPSVMQVLDAVLLDAYENLLSVILPAVPGCFVGARPRTQCLDIAHGLQTVIEKGLDNFGAAAVAQADIEKYYDSLPVLRIARWLVSNGTPACHAACLVRHQMCPRIVLRSGTIEFELGNRTVGALTGSRTAGLLGRIPVEAILVDRHAQWEAHGFHKSQGSLTMCTWVDNLFSASDSLEGAISILEDFEYQLEVHWKMKIKPTSRSCMVAAGCVQLPADMQRWPLKDSFVVLGHILEHTGSIRACWKHARASMWRAYWSNPGANAANHISMARRVQLLAQAVQPQLVFRCSRWPPQRQIATEVDTLQQRMNACMLRLPRLPHEEPDAYVRRRGRLARSHCQQAGLWSRIWFQRAVAWDEHLTRGHNHQTWSAQLHDFRDKAWLMQRRADFDGRTCTRAVHGKVQMRWHDGVDFAKSRL